MPCQSFEHDLMAETFQFKVAMVRSASGDSGGCTRLEEGGKAQRVFLEKSTKTSEGGQKEEPQEEKEGMDSEDTDHFLLAEVTSAYSIY
jgi:hypothetical protein